MTTTGSNGHRDVSALTAFEPQSLGELMKLADWMAGSQLLPKHLQEKPRDIVLIAMKGRELGITLMQAIAGIYIIDGKTVLAADLIVAVVKRSPDVEFFRLVESSDAIATYEAKRCDDPQPTRLSFTIAQAQTAGLAGRGTWQKYPAAMLRARCSSALAKIVDPGKTMGLYDTDEGEDMRERNREPVHAVITQEPEPLGDADPGYEAFAESRASLGSPLSRDEAVTLWRDHAASYALAPRVRAENGERVQSELMAATVPAFASVYAFRNAVKHAEYRDGFPAYDTIARDVWMCAAVEEIAAAWMTGAAHLDALPPDVTAFALAWCGSQVTRLDPTLKQGTAWLKKRIAELGGTPPEKPTRGPNGRNAHSDPTPSASAAAEASAPVAAAAQASADPEREAIVKEGMAELAVILREQWHGGTVTPETWRAHLEMHTTEQAIANSFAKHEHRFGRAAEKSTYRNVTTIRLREIGLSDVAAANAVDAALKARTAKAEKAAA